MTTDEMITALSHGVRPIHRVIRPPRLTMRWFVIAGLVVGGMVALRGPRADLSLRLQDTTFVISILGAIATAILAGVAATITSMPDRSRLWGLLAIPPAVLWLSTIGEGCLLSWQPLARSPLPDNEPMDCIITLLSVAVPLSVAMIWMLRHAAMFRTTDVAVNAGLAVAAGAATALAAIHQFDASLLVLIWSFGVVTLLLPAHLLGFEHLRRRLSHMMR